MNVKLPLLTIVFAAIGAHWLIGKAPSCAGAEGPEAGPTSSSAAPSNASNVATPIIRSAGAQLIERARSTLSKRQSVAARVRFRVRLFGADVVGSGIYLQLARNEALHFLWELRTQVAGDTSSLTQVSDGRFLWTDRILPGGQTVTRVDLRQLSTPNQAGATDRGSPYDVRMGDNAGAVGGLLGGEGLPRMLAVVEEKFAFGEARLATWRDVPVYVVKGRAAESAGTPEKDGDASSIETPRHLRIVFGRDDLFPYRMEFFDVGGVQSAGDSNGDGRPALLVEWFDVQLDGPIDARRFTYAPPAEANWRDITDELRASRATAD